MSLTTIMQRSDLLIYTIIINIVLIIYIKAHSSKSDFSSKLFSYIVIAITIISFLEAITMLNSTKGDTAQIPYRYWGNYLFLSLTNLPGSLALSYMDYKILCSEKGTKKRILLYMIPTYVAILSGILNFFFEGLLFTVSPENVYIRGLFVYINLYVMYAFLLFVFIAFYKRRNLITGRTISSIMIIFFIPILGSILQSFFLGVTFGMPSYTLALFVVFLILEKDEMGKDYLTGLYTRQKMESRLRYKIKNNDPFIVVMADMDGFKSINDNYGHSEGDNALKMAAKILQKSINLEDMVCRYGGDEFLILIESEKDISDMFMNRIDRAFERLNNNTQYHIGLSYGFEFVSNPETQNLDELLDRIDKRMYVNKESKKLSDVIKS